jgi:hypothetical protein
VSGVKQMTCACTKKCGERCTQSFFVEHLQRIIEQQLKLKNVADALSQRR